MVRDPMGARTEKPPAFLLEVPEADACYDEDARLSWLPVFL
jgi:hypothetical protein